MEKVIYKCGCYASGDNVSDKCPIHGNVISKDAIEVNPQMTTEFITTQELEKEIERLHKYERWFDDIYGMMPGILWDSNKIAWSKEKAFKKLLAICETADQFKAMKKKYDALREALRTLVEAAKISLNSMTDDCLMGHDDHEQPIKQVRRAIAAVEAIISPPRSAAYTGGGGKRHRLIFNSDVRIH